MSIPGEAPWVKDAHKKQEASGSNLACGSQRSNKLKRNHDDEEEEAMEEDHVMEMETDHPSAPNAKPEENKKAKMESGAAMNSGTPETSDSLTLNLPLPSSKGQACIVKVYDVEEDNKTFKVNDVYEFVGIVSLDPTMAAFPSNDTQQEDPFADFNQQEKLAKSPPPSLVPRLHVLSGHRLKHCNPLLPSNLPKHSELLKEEASKCRTELHAILTKALFGDELAADYMICHLISRIYLRKDVLNLGKMSVNLFNVPLCENFTKRLSTLIQLLGTKSHYLPLTIDNLNKLSYVPKKDYHANRLISGILQLSQNTHLLLDETKLTNGELNPAGVSNLTALGTVISWQKIEYNFNFHKLDFATDIPCLVMSEGRSMLPSDSQVMLRPKEVVSEEVIKEKYADIGTSLTSELLDKLRKYLTVVRHFSFDVSDEMQAAVQEDFVRERQGGGDAGGRVTAEELHHMLVLARLYSLSLGDVSLQAETWQKVKALERERKERMVGLPARPSVGNRPVVANQ